MQSRTRLILVGLIPILLVAALIIGVFLLGTLPGFAGEIFRKIAGFMFSPFFLEATFASLGLIAVLCINNIRLKLNGDDYVTLEIDEKSKKEEP